MEINISAEILLVNPCFGKVYLGLNNICKFLYSDPSFPYAPHLERDFGWGCIAILCPPPIPIFYERGDYINFPTPDIFLTFWSLGIGSPPSLNFESKRLRKGGDYTNFPPRRYFLIF